MPWTLILSLSWRASLIVGNTQCEHFTQCAIDLQSAKRKKSGEAACNEVMRDDLLAFAGSITAYLSRQHTHQTAFCFSTCENVRASEHCNQGQLLSAQQ
jgi:hypothetical protein